MVVKIDPEDVATVQLAKERLYSCDVLLSKIAAERHAAVLAIQLSDMQHAQVVGRKERLHQEAVALSEQMAQKYGIISTDQLDWENGTITKAPPQGAPGLPPGATPAGPPRQG